MTVSFINEVPSLEDIRRFDLPFERDIELPSDLRRTWTVDRQRNIFLWGGRTGNPAKGEEIKGVFVVNVGDICYRVELSPGKGSMNFGANPYVVRWDSVDSVRVIKSILARSAVGDGGVSRVIFGNVAAEVICDEGGCAGDISHEQLLDILREALTVYGAGQCNRFIKHPIDVVFGF